MKKSILVFTMVTLSWVAAADAKLILKCRNADGSRIHVTDKHFYIAEPGRSTAMRYEYVRTPDFGAEVIGKPLAWTFLAMVFGSEQATEAIQSFRCRAYRSAAATLKVCWDVNDPRSVAGEVEYWFTKTKSKCHFAKNEPVT